ncbi:MAG: DUF2937 family protein [Parachlamydiaceae bacterium]|nr:DUF2937 family protein [Parachlamydiaceae bacterium]
MQRLLGGLLDRVLAVAGALLFALLPMFMLQYTQQLAGRAAELGLQLNSLQRIAQDSGKTLHQYILKFTSNNDPDFMQQGALMEKMSQRFSYLSQAEIDIANASPLAKPFVFLQHLDTDIAKTTLNYFQFGIPFSIEGLAYALAGLGFGCLLFYVLSKIMGLITGLWKKIFFIRSHSITG